MSRAYRRAHPLCEDCQAEGRVTPADEVHHLDPVRTGADVLVTPDKLRALCKGCHRRRTVVEHGGRQLTGCDESGWPTNGAHPWARKRSQG